MGGGGEAVSAATTVSVLDPQTDNQANRESFQTKKTFTIKEAWDSQEQAAGDNLPPPGVRKVWTVQMCFIDRGRRVAEDKEVQSWGRVHRASLFLYVWSFQQKFSVHTLKEITLTNVLTKLDKTLCKLKTNSGKRTHIHKRQLSSDWSERQTTGSVAELNKANCSHPLAVFVLS